MGQFNLSTKSGQELLVSADGSYINKEEIVTKDSDSFMGAEIGSKESATQVKYDIDHQHLITLNDLRQQLKEIEAKSTIARYQHKQELSALNKSIRALRKSDASTDKIYELLDEYDHMEVEYDLENMRAEESYKLIQKLAKAYQTDDKQRTTYINDLVLEAQTRLGVSTAIIKVYDPNQYLFKKTEGYADQLRHKGDCDIIFNDIDRSIDKRRIEHAPQHFFGYTSDKLKHFFKEKNFLNCNAYITKVEGDYFLNLDLDLASKDASRSYGFINKGDMIRVTFIDGQDFITNALYRVDGTIEAYSGHMIYRVVYPLEDYHLDLLHDTEIDKLGIIWSSGFEEYPIYEIDILMHQLECIDNAD